MSDNHETALQSAISALSDIGLKNGLQIDERMARHDIERAIEDYQLEKREYSCTTKGRDRATALASILNSIQNLIGSYEHVLLQPGLISPMERVCHYEPGCDREPKQHIQELILLLKTHEDWLNSACELANSEIGPKGRPPISHERDFIVEMADIYEEHTCPNGDASCLATHGYNVLAEGPDKICGLFVHFVRSVVTTMALQPDVRGDWGNRIVGALEYRKAKAETRMPREVRDEIRTQRRVDLMDRYGDETYATTPRDWLRLA